MNCLDRLLCLQCPVQRFTAMSLLCSCMLLVEIASVFCCRLCQALGPYLLRIKVIGALLSLCLWLAMEHHRLCFSSPATSQHQHAQLRSMPQARLDTSDNKFFIMDPNKYLLFVFYNRNCISYSYF